MIACTSVSPTHKNGSIQLTALQSWRDHGFKVYCFQSPKEVEFLKPHYPDWVNWIPTHRTGEKQFKAPYVHINAFIDWAKDNADSFLLINSDIVMKSTPERMKEIYDQAHKGLIVFNRWDYQQGNEAGAKRYDWGMDAFIFHKSFYQIYPQSPYVMGQTWWDFWIPYRTVIESINIMRVEDKALWHLEHPIQYNSAEWMHMVKYFQWENNFFPELSKRPQRINDLALAKITNAFNKTKGLLK